MNADLSLYNRQLISRFDIRCSALLPPVVVVQVVTVHRSSSSKHTLRDDWWRARGLPAVPSGLVFSDRSHPAPHAIFLPPSLCCQTCSLYQWDGWDVHRSVRTTKKGLGDLLRQSRWHRCECTLHTHSYTFTAFCGPNSLCLLSKDWLGKIPFSVGAPKPPQRLNSG